MSDDEILNENEDQPTHALIEKIKDGALDPRTLGKDTRQQCVELFIFEGYGISAIAQILKRSDKTIKRDLEEIRERNALNPDPDFARRQIGEMVMSARINRAHLMRLARSKAGKISEKAQAEYYAHRISVELVEKLQSLGYLPSQPHAIVGELYHHIDDRILDSISTQVVEMEGMISQSGEVPALVHEELKKAKELTQKMITAKDAKNKEVSNEA